MTYAGFLLVFLVAPIAASLAFSRNRSRELSALGVLLVFVFAATLPWDSAAVAQGLWSFDPEKTWQPRVALLPVEELCFFALQSVLTGIWVRRAVASSRTR
jgi:lycopene cyclase domain-containing protein